jgi:hypothetical protein
MIGLGLHDKVDTASCAEHDHFNLGDEFWLQPKVSTMMRRLYMQGDNARFKPADFTPDAIDVAVHIPYGKTAELDISEWKIGLKRVKMDLLRDAKFDPVAKEAFDAATLKVTKENAAARDYGTRMAEVSMQMMEQRDNVKKEAPEVLQMKEKMATKLDELNALGMGAEKNAAKLEFLKLKIDLANLQVSTAGANGNMASHAAAAKSAAQSTLNATLSSKTAQSTEIAERSKKASKIQALKAAVEAKASEVTSMPAGDEKIAAKRLFLQMKADLFSEIADMQGDESEVGASAVAQKTSIEAAITEMDATKFSSMPMMNDLSKRSQTVTPPEILSLKAAVQAKATEISVMHDGVEKDAAKTLYLQMKAELFGQIANFKGLDSEVGASAAAQKAAIHAALSNRKGSGIKLAETEKTALAETGKSLCIFGYCLGDTSLEDAAADAATAAAPQPDHVNAGAPPPPTKIRFHVYTEVKPESLQPLVDWAAGQDAREVQLHIHQMDPLCGENPACDSRNAMRARGRKR